MTRRCLSRLEDSQFGGSNQYSARQASPLDSADFDSEFGHSLLDVPHRFDFNVSASRAPGRRT